MKIFKNRTSLIQELNNVKNISFVPTMGGLHKGHKYLIRKALKTSRKVLVSIYVNPKQFNSKKDFTKYPRNLNKDILILKRLKIDYLYLPNNKDIFGFKSKKKIYLDSFSKKLCGKYRKNHFKGVVTVINQFLEIIEPKYIFLGKKDFQQLYLIKLHIKKRRISTKVIECKTIREKNGLACSTRNKNLNYKEKLIASSIYKSLKKEKSILKKNIITIKKIKDIIKTLKKFSNIKLEYFTLINTNNPKKKFNSRSKFNIFVAYYLGRTRLIDNF